MEDLTVVFITINRVPKKWAEYHKEKLLEAIGDFPLITISEKPMPDMPGINILQNEYPKVVANVTYQILRGAKLAKTKYIAVAEDDTLYPKEHFLFYRPKLDTIAYNLNKWSLFTWGIPTYSYRRAKANGALITPRALLIEALEERFNKYPNLDNRYCGGEIGRIDIEKRLKVAPRKAVEVYSHRPIVSFKHKYSVDPYQRTQRKSLARIRALDIPYWGRAEDLVKKFI